MIIAAISVLGLLGLIFGALLAYSSKKFAVYVDPKIEKLNEILPGLNCGACGYAGCSGYSTAIINDNVEINKCTVGGKDTINEMAHFLGVESSDHEQLVAIVHCSGDNEKCKMKYIYKGVADCRALTLVADGDKACKYSCLGQGDCVRVCPANAIVTENEVAYIKKGKCIGCGLCVKICPRDVIELVPLNKNNHIVCSSQDKGPIAKKHCNVSCIGCGICKKNCPTDCITIDNFLAIIDYSKCIDCGVCSSKCPTKAIENQKKPNDKSTPEEKQKELL